MPWPLSSYNFAIKPAVLGSFDKDFQRFLPTKIPTFLSNFVEFLIDFHGQILGNDDRKPTPSQNRAK